MNFSMSTFGTPSHNNTQRESLSTGMPEGESRIMDGLPILRDIRMLIPQDNFQAIELEFTSDNALLELQEGAVLDSMSEGVAPINKIKQLIDDTKDPKNVRDPDDADLKAFITRQIDELEGLSRITSNAMMNIAKSSATRVFTEMSQDVSRAKKCIDINSSIHESLPHISWVRSGNRG